MDRKPLITEIKAIVLLLVAPCIVLLLYCIINKYDLVNHFYSFIVAIIICSFIAGLLKPLEHHAAVSKLRFILSLPLSLITTVSIIIIPIITLFIHTSLYFFLALILPLIIFRLLEWLHIVELNKITVVYLSTSGTVIIAVLLNDLLKKIVFRISPGDKSKKLKPFNLETLSQYFLSEKNIRFTIYALYLIAIILINFETFESNSVTSEAGASKAILQSFVTFIAFERAATYLKQLEFKPSELLNKTLLSIRKKFEHLDDEIDKMKDMQ